MVNNNKKDFHREIERIKKIADMMCTMHSILREKFSRRAFLLDAGIMASSVWLVAMVFVEPTIGQKLSPHGLESNIWLGILSIITFFFSIVQFKVNWKEKSDAHHRSAEFYLSIKRESVYMLTQYEDIDMEKCKHLLDRYDSSGDICITIPENKFLTLKKSYKQKVLISRYTDKNPWVSIILLRLRLWVKGNMKIYTYNADEELNGKS